MVAAGYLSAIGLYGIAGAMALQAKKQRKIASQLKEGLSNTIPKEGEKAAYVALKCLGTPRFSPWFPTNHEILVGRYFIAKAKPYMDAGFGLTNHDDQKEEGSACLPKELYLTSGSHEVIVHHLDLAKWVGKQTKTTLHGPQNAAILLKEIHKEPDFTTKYQLTAHWFEANHLTLFAEATHIEGRIYLKKPTNGYPFVATTMDPKAYLESVQVKSTFLQKRSKRAALAATMTGSAVRAYQLSTQLGKPPQLKKVYACAAICMIAGGALMRT